MTRILISIVLLCTICSCHQRNSPEESPTILKDKEPSASEGLKNLPPGFKIDSIQNVDEGRNLVVSLELPVSGITNLDSAVVSQILMQRDQFIESLDEMITKDPRILTTISSGFTVDVISAHQDNHVMSYLFEIDFHHASAAHGMYTYYSFNYHLSGNESISFGDYFEVTSTMDTTLFLDLISKNLNNEWLSLSDLNSIDFNIEADTISFNFDNYEIGPYSQGAPRARISKNVLMHKISSKFK